MPRPIGSPVADWSPTLGRSVLLLRDFRHEQDDPDRFYGALARDSVGQVGSYAPLRGATVLDIGGGPGYFRSAFADAGAQYFAVDADAGELAGLGSIAGGTLIGDGMRLPIRDDSVDVCYSSNVLEHVRRPWDMAEEMVRVTRPGGIAFISYTVWFGPWGGHETSPWHYLGGTRARERYRAREGKEPKNKFGESLFAVTVSGGIAWARRQRQADVVDILPRYHPRGGRWLVRVPVVREVATWNLALVLRKR